MLNEHVVGQCDCYLLVIEYYVLRHLLAIPLYLKMVRASCRRKEYWISPEWNSGRLHNHYIFAASAAKFWKHDISSASERAFPGFFGNIFGCSTLSKRRCFSTQESNNSCRKAGKTHLPVSLVLAQSEQFEASKSVGCKWGIPRAVYLIFCVILPGFVI